MTEVYEASSMKPFQLKDVFDRYQGRPFVFVVPGGNYGDHLIWRGAEKLARSHGLVFRSCSSHEALRSQFAPEEAVYIHGGGGFVPWWSGGGIKVLQHLCESHPGPLIYGPCTVDPTNMSFLRECLAPVPKSSAEEVLILARERPSFEALQEVLDTKHVGLDHDTALYLESSDFPHIVQLMKSRSDYDFIASRVDAEGVGDCPRISLDPVKIARSFDHWLAMHACARSIVTNRLHSSIAGSIFGVPTTLSSNSYHKARSVWEYSLQERGVQWADSIPGSAAPSSLLVGLVGLVSPKLKDSVTRRHLWRVQPKQLGLD